MLYKAREEELLTGFFYSFIFGNWLDVCLKCVSFLTNVLSFLHIPEMVRLMVAEAMSPIWKLYGIWSFQLSIRLFDLFSWHTWVLFPSLSFIHPPPSNLSNWHLSIERYMECTTQHCEWPQNAQCNHPWFEKTPEKKMILIPFPHLFANYHRSPHRRGLGAT